MRTSWLAFLFLGVSITTSTTPASSAASAASAPTFGPPRPVTIRGYGGDTKEPEISRDGRYLFFNDNNDTQTNCSLFYAERVNDYTFTYRGKVRGVQSALLDVVPAVDAAGDFYFVSNRSYDTSLSTIYGGRLSNGTVSSVRIVPGISKGQAPWVNFDVAISPDGRTMYFVDALFSVAGGLPLTADLVMATRTSKGFVRAPDSGRILANVNTPHGLEYAASISSDGRQLYFTRARDASLPNTAIFVASRRTTKEAFGVPAQLTTLKGFVEGPSITRDAKGLYFHQQVGDRWHIFRASRRS